MLFYFISFWSPSGNGSQVRPSAGSPEEPRQIPEGSVSDLAAPVHPQPELTHSSTIRLDPLVCSPLRLEPVNTSTLRLDPHTSSMLRSDPLRTSLPGLEPASLTGGLSPRSVSTPSLDPLSLHQEPPREHPGPQGGTKVFSYLKPFTAPPVAEQEPPTSSPTSPDTKSTANHQDGTPVVVPLPDPPPNSCLKTGTLTNHKESRSSSRVGLRVHFKLPEDEEEEEEEERREVNHLFDEDNTDGLSSKEPPPVLAKPKL